MTPLTYVRWSPSKRIAGPRANQFSLLQLEMLQPEFSGNIHGTIVVRVGKRGPEPRCLLLLSFPLILLPSVFTSVFNGILDRERRWS